MQGIFLDSETNGLNPFIHKIIELAFKIINLATGDEIYTFETIVFQPKEVWDKSKKESLEINGFNYDMVLKGKEEKTVANEIINIFTRQNIQRKKAVFICQNPSFDRIFFSKLIDPVLQEDLNWPYHWLDLASMYWALNIEKTKNIEFFKGFSKDQIAESLNLPHEEKPHRAINGVNHLILCYENLVGFPKKFS